MIFIPRGPSWRVRALVLYQKQFRIIKTCFFRTRRGVLKAKKLSILLYFVFSNISVSSFLYSFPFVQCDCVSFWGPNEQNRLQAKRLNSQKPKEKDDLTRPRPKARLILIFVMLYLTFFLHADPGHYTKIEFPMCFLILVAAWSWSRGTVRRRMRK